MPSARPPIQGHPTRNRYDYQPTIGSPNLPARQPVAASHQTKPRSQHCRRARTVQFQSPQQQRRQRSRRRTQQLQHRRLPPRQRPQQSGPAVRQSATEHKNQIGAEHCRPAKQNVRRRTADYAANGAAHPPEGNITPNIGFSRRSPLPGPDQTLRRRDRSARTGQRSQHAGGKQPAAVAALPDCDHTTNAAPLTDSAPPRNNRHTRLPLPATGRG